jgi:hypothetical protein
MLSDLDTAFVGVAAALCSKTGKEKNRKFATGPKNGANEDHSIHSSPLDQRMVQMKTIVYTLRHWTKEWCK